MDKLEWTHIGDNQIGAVINGEQHKHTYIRVSRNFPLWWAYVGSPINGGRYCLTLRGALYHVRKVIRRLDEPVESTLADRANQMEASLGGD